MDGVLEFVYSSPLARVVTAAYSVSRPLTIRRGSTAWEHNDGDSRTTTK
jgi:hypothetical protein